jgi:hypothetical protein
MADNKGTAGEDIGRPGPWGENRYQKPGESIDKSVRTPAGTVPGERPDISTPVTRKDYGIGDDDKAPGGDAG